MSFQHLDDQQPFVPDDAFRAAALHEGRRRRRRRLSLAAGSGAAVVIAVVALLVAVPRSDTTTVDTPPASTTTTTAEVPVTSSPTTVTTAAPTTTTAAPVVRTEASPMSFDSPSHNIGCVMVDRFVESPAGAVRCDIIRYSYAPPEPASECPLDYGYSLTLERGVPGFGCSSDYVGGTGPVLDHGTGVRVGPNTCVSTIEGITCSDDEGHGFFLSEEAYRLF